MKEKIIEILQDACALNEIVTEDKELKELSLDSLSFVQVVVDIEDTFQIEFDIDEMQELYQGTVGQIIEKTEEKVNDRK